MTRAAILARVAASNWLDRYRSGARDQVWHELRALGPEVRRPEHLEQAQAVCDEMAVRARYNIEVLVARLTDQGYRFHCNDDEQTPEVAFVGATAESASLQEWLEDSIGPVPLTVSSWLRLVGDVWLVGTHPQWESSADADPLVIDLAGLRYPTSSVRDYYSEELEMWRDTCGAVEGRDGVAFVGADPREGFVLPVSPDYLHKANVSGGGPYGFRLPDASVDALFVGEVVMPFVEYLNGVFRSGGFPLDIPAAEQDAVRHSLAYGLLEL
jgi:hypothetical protein